MLYSLQDPEQHIHAGTDADGDHQHGEHGQPARHQRHQGGLQEAHRARRRVRLAVRRHALGELIDVQFLAPNSNTNPTRSSPSSRVG